MIVCGARKAAVLGVGIETRMKQVNGYFIVRHY